MTTAAAAPLLDPPAPDSDRGRDLIKRARAIRQRAGIGFSQMCRELGVCKSTLQRYETDPPAQVPARFVGVLAVLDGWQAYPPPIR